MSSSDWSDEENRQIVSAYFEMLSQELDGRHYNKSEKRRKLIQVIGRSEGSIERKNQNISAVLKSLGERWINGYKPLFNYQESLEGAVSAWLQANPEWFERMPVPQDFSEAHSLFLEQAPTLRNAPPPSETEQAARTAQKFDVALRDERNRRLGRAGEQIALRHEQETLRQAGRQDLANKVEWISDTRGDGAGFDIASYASDGTRRFVEVKTTNGWERTPFHISSNELEFARENESAWRLIRLWNFSRGPRAFELSPPLERHVSLTPTSFRASF